MAGHMSPVWSMNRVVQTLLIILMLQGNEQLGNKVLVAWLMLPGLIPFWHTQLLVLVQGLVLPDKEMLNQSFLSSGLLGLW